MVSNIRRNKTDSPGCVGVQQLPNTPGQDGVDQYVRIENNHLNALIPSRAGAFV